MKYDLTRIFDPKTGRLINTDKNGKHVCQWFIASVAYYTMKDGRVLVDDSMDDLEHEEVDGELEKACDNPKYKSKIKKVQYKMICTCGKAKVETH
jgi:hypothetical protein